MSTELLRDILTANATYAEAFSRADPALLAKLAKGQSPKICWLGCSDSRVSAELCVSSLICVVGAWLIRSMGVMSGCRSTGVAPGSIFVHRNIAQCFHPGDNSALAAITYAITQLKVEAIIVCGHTGCGGVKAAMMAAQEESVNGAPTPVTSASMKVISDWVAPIKQLALDQLTAANMSIEAAPSNGHPHTSYDPLSPHSLATLTDHHVAETVRQVAESDVVREAWASGMKLSVHGWVYHVATAKLRDLDIGVEGVDKKSESLQSRPSSYAGSEPPDEMEDEE
ncbi:carbonic anhydrase, partial [Phenoliferia sp. Uapishka_3]